MQAPSGLHRFVNAQRSAYPTAFEEIKSGKKKSHWMWFIFPQIKGLAQSETSAMYAIENREEADAFLRHEVLGARLVQISKALLYLPSDNATEIFGYPDDLKLLSCMTLFSEIQKEEDVFEKVLVKFFAGRKDKKTLAILAAEN